MLRDRFIDTYDKEGMMSTEWAKLPILKRNENLLFIDTSGYPLPGKIVPCLLCGDPFLMRKYMGTPDQICERCHKTYDECAIVICRQCNVTICRLIPTVIDTGYYIRPRSVLHSDKCNICSPGLTQSTIEEIDEWERMCRPKKVIILPSKYS